VNRLVRSNGKSQEEVVAVDWLQGLWGYIIETKSLELFQDVFPIAPVIQPPSLPGMTDYMSQTPTFLKIYI
jgi:hypothetical protein